MSKQDGTSPRTAADLERKYNFGQSFAEVYGLVEEAQRAAEEAKTNVGELDQEKIFNLLTNYGQAKGVYRDEAGNLYVNASYIQSGELKGENLKVDAATIHGKLIATQVDIKDLEVNAAKVTGKLTAAEIDANKITGGTLDFGKVTAKNLEVDFADITGTLQIGEETDFKNGVVDIIEGTVDADYVNALGVYASELVSEGNRDYETITIKNGTIDFSSGAIYDKEMGCLLIEAAGVLELNAYNHYKFGFADGGYWVLEAGAMYYYDADRNITHEVRIDSV